MNKPATDFWSRRKAKVAQEAQAEEIVQDVPQEDLSDAEILAKFDLPDPDTLKLGDDIKGFMSKAVPEHLRRRALRKLWRTNPVLACLDGLNDYEDDFTDAATVMPDIYRHRGRERDAAARRILHLHGHQLVRTGLHDICRPLSE